jgi:hypothetical protein
MPSIENCPLPPQALLARYAHDGAYTDCFATEIAGHIDLARYVQAFYTTPLFRTERLILRLAIRAASTDEQARQVARGAIERFAAWRVEDRAPNQLLMCDIHGSTRSWFMIEPVGEDSSPHTRLYFGSAVVAAALRRPLFRLLLGFHVLYSKALLRSARKRLADRSGEAGP